MFFELDIKGDRLPPGVLCLTFDDGPDRTEKAEGPGPRTDELGAYLRSMGVPATFFVVGEFASKAPDILEGLKRDGHLVANHTRDHPSLPGFVAEGGDVIGQLAATDATITDFIDGETAFFRAPYGDWRLKGEARSNVAEVLNRSAMAGRCVGPIGWDIDVGDVGFWRDDRPAEDCARAYLEAIEQIGRGIVLMHDNTADIPEIRARNRALGMVRWLVPELQKRGYRFIRLDEVPQAASAARVDAMLTLTTLDGRWVAASPSSDELVFVSGASAPPEAIFGRVELGEGRWAIRAANGCFLSPGDGEILANAPAAGDRETLLVEDRDDGAIVLRTIDGRCLGQGAEGDDRVRAFAPIPTDLEAFRAADPSAKDEELAVES